MTSSLASPATGSQDSGVAGPAAGGDTGACGTRSSKQRHLSRREAVPSRRPPRPRRAVAPGGWQAAAQTQSRPGASLVLAARNLRPL